MMERRYLNMEERKRNNGGIAEDRNLVVCIRAAVYIDSGFYLSADDDLPQTGARYGPPLVVVRIIQPGPLSKIISHKHKRQPPVLILHPGTRFFEIPPNLTKPYLSSHTKKVSQ
jgi:hypothetical protein